ncbi:hypothetical protein HHK36_016216 [Tetracentron sinense]|uniref:Yippee domain-containing protein n=1 Tax=Tetracentron sinense TaxID=13715 RepID=A0A835DBA4_TETSI|nr:hypothetical protein HHK36_016216 [Tetracentron sinense]
MGRLFVITLEGRIYSCKHCQTHLALCEDIISKDSLELLPSKSNDASSTDCLGGGLTISISGLITVLAFSGCRWLESPGNSWLTGGVIIHLWLDDMVLGNGAERMMRRVMLEQAIAVSFYCRHGKAYLFNKVVNVTVGEKEERMMMTGMHIVADIFCVACGSIVGWKYEAAHEKNQKYKEGKFILERFKVSFPIGSNYRVGNGAPAGVSDADDA